MLPAPMSESSDPTVALGLTSDGLSAAGFRHAFFMRRGGVSEPPWATLNFSTASGDRPEAVGENLRRAARELGVDAARIYYLSQQHGCDVTVLSGAEDREQLLYVEGDVTASHAPTVACAVRMADCAGVLLADRRSGAVAAVHSGWRGTVQGVVAAGVRALEQLSNEWRRGTSLDLVAAVGPHIEACCFEVGDDVAEQLASCTGLGEQVVDRSRAKPHVDLRAIIEAQLRTLGVGQVDHVAGCTMCDSERFHSYRRDGKRSGRMMAAIVGRAPT
jgi:YfiH family protein